ncbi:BP74-related protein [Nonomuraea endophytica]|uniref:BP74 N-terminal domain-containing protein n=1 Tax=Nonomuraea endophytica TaxID=714136 RepID=A0A7W8EJN8_9ACTN|nr:hypothetical protein [Nonomuraea endophytica]MBB5081716.1 hypothetical protein [Nonomuraea endophytica]
MFNALRMATAVTVSAIGLIAAGSPVQAGTAAAEYVATINTGGETFRVRLVESNDVDAAYRNMSGVGNRQHINGKILPGTDVNTGWSWHLDPGDLEFVDVSMELCDGKPSDVENGTLSGDRFCPWGTQVVDIQPL